MADYKSEFDDATINQPATQDRTASVDEALVFLKDHEEHAITDEATLKAIRRKVDWRISPILACVFLVQNLDKFALNV